jgi:hypothetical protein
MAEFLDGRCSRYVAMLSGLETNLSGTASHLHRHHLRPHRSTYYRSLTKARKLISALVPDVSLSNWRCLPRSGRAARCARPRVTTEIPLAVMLNLLAKLIVSFGG